MNSLPVPYLLIVRTVAFFIHTLLIGSKVTNFFPIAVQESGKKPVDKSVTAVCYLFWDFASGCCISAFSEG